MNENREQANIDEGLDLSWTDQNGQFECALTKWLDDIIWTRPQQNAKCGHSWVPSGQCWIDAEVRAMSESATAFPQATSQSCWCECVRWPIGSRQSYICLPMETMVYPGPSVCSRIVSISVCEQALTRGDNLGPSVRFLLSLRTGPAAIVEGGETQNFGAWNLLLRQTWPVMYCWKWVLSKTTLCIAKNR